MKDVLKFKFLNIKQLKFVNLFKNEKKLLPSLLSSIDHIPILNPYIMRIAREHTYIVECERNWQKGSGTELSDDANILPDRATSSLKLETVMYISNNTPSTVLKVFNLCFIRFIVFFTMIEKFCFIVPSIHIIMMLKHEPKNVKTL